MKFLYSDTQDYVDPGYDFLNDRNAPGRRRYWDDRYAHEIMDPPPYDGLLVAISGVRAAKGVKTGQGRYSLAEEQRFLRDGGRRFLRFDGDKFKSKMFMGDCGAFAYAALEKPAYSPEEVYEFYVDAGFTHGCHPDHVIFEFNEDNPGPKDIDPTVLGRFDITLANAEKFMAVTKAGGFPFVPIGSIQGWSPASMAEAGRRLEAMGYRYLAVGGLVPLKTDAIHVALKAIREAIKPSTKLHLLGFAKADRIHEFLQYGIESFDSTSPLIRAFKDAKANYYLELPDGGLEYFAAVRIPQALENPRLMQMVKAGDVSQELLQKKERAALSAIRDYDQGNAGLQQAFEVLSDYQSMLTPDAETTKVGMRAKAKSDEQLLRTLKARPWKSCSCSICRDVGVEVIIFRSSNRNKRRGFHNLGAYYSHLKRTIRDSE